MYSCSFFTIIAYHANVNRTLHFFINDHSAAHSCHIRSTKCKKSPYHDPFNDFAQSYWPGWTLPWPCTDQKLEKLNSDIWFASQIEHSQIDLCSEYLHTLQESKIIKYLCEDGEFLRMLVSQPQVCKINASGNSLASPWRVASLKHGAHSSLPSLAKLKSCLHAGPVLKVSVHAPRKIEASPRVFLILISFKTVPSKFSTRSFHVSKQSWNFSLGSAARAAFVLHRMSRRKVPCFQVPFGFCEQPKVVCTYVRRLGSLTNRWNTVPCQKRWNNLSCIILVQLPGLRIRWENFAGSHCILKQFLKKAFVVLLLLSPAEHLLWVNRLSLPLMVHTS